MFKFSWEVYIIKLLIINERMISTKVWNLYNYFVLYTIVVSLQLSSGDVVWDNMIGGGSVKIQMVKGEFEPNYRILAY